MSDKRIFYRTCMGHFDQHFNFSANPKYATNPDDRKKLNSIMNNCTEELATFSKAHPTIGTNTRLKPTDYCSREIRTSIDINADKKPNVLKGTKVITNSKGSAASDKKPNVEKDSEKVTRSKTTANSNVIVSSYTTDHTTDIKITVKSNSRAKYFHIDFDIDACT